MTRNSSAFTRDANNVPIDNLGLTASKAITYVAGTTGAVGATTLFTVTGDVAVRVYAVCSTLLTGAGSLAVGVASETTALITTTTGTDIDAGEIWVDATPGFIQAMPSINLIGTGKDIIQTIASDTITAGVLTYYCIWNPLSTDGNVVAA